MREKLSRRVPVACVECIFDGPVILEHGFALTPQHGKFGMNFADMADQAIKAALKQLRNQQRNVFRGCLINAYDRHLGNGAHTIELLQDGIQFFRAFIGGRDSNKGKRVRHPQRLAVVFDKNSQSAKSSGFQRFTITHRSNGITAGFPRRDRRKWCAQHSHPLCKSQLGRFGL